MQCLVLLRSLVFVRVASSISARLEELAECNLCAGERVSLTFASPCARGVGEASVARVRSDRAEQRRYPADECTALAGEQREVGEFHDPSDGKCLREFRRYTAHRE